MDNWLGFEILMQDYFSILGVRRDASERQIKDAYRRLAKEFHPDVSSHPDAKRRFVEISEAYIILSDPEKRKWLRSDEIRKHRERQKQAAYEAWVKKQQILARKRAEAIANSDYAKFEQSPIYKTAMALNNIYDYIFLALGLGVTFGPLVAWRNAVLRDPEMEYSLATFLGPMTVGAIFTLAIYYYLFVLKRENQQDEE